MEAENNLQIGKYLGQIGNDGKDLTTANAAFTANSNVVRIAALETSYIYNKNRGKGTDGVCLPANTIQHFKVNVGDEIALVSGKVNICSVS